MTQRYIGEFKFIRRHSKIDVTTISGFLFSVHMFACKDENVKFFSLKVLI